MIQEPLLILVPSLPNRKANQELIDLLETVGTLRSEYPPELLKARRAAFIIQVEQRRRSNNQILKCLDK